jgi:hypothetical protein
MQRSKSSLFDHLVGAGEQRWWNFEPIAFALLRLITSSNVVGCSMGKLAGCAPFKILSTSEAARRIISE